jgi:hypothetical protein
METLGKHFQSLSKAAFQRHGFAQADLLSQWAAIAGNDVAAICKPDKIKWPRRANPDDRGDGTLVVRASPGRSLDVQYQTPRLLNRINQYFGYEAVTAIKVVQSTGLDDPLPHRRVAAQPDAAIYARVEAIADDELRQALARLGANIAANGRSPQPK